MSERSHPAPASNAPDQTPEERAEPSARATWTVEDDELLLLDEIDDETPDEPIDDLV